MTQAPSKVPSKVLFDARWVRPGMTGVGHYARNILRSRAIPRENCAVILGRNCPFAEEFAGFRIFRTGVDIVDHPVTDLFEQFVIPWLCYRHGYGTFVSFEGRSPVFHPGIRTFSVIYDLTYALVKGSHSRKYAFFLGLHARLSRLFASGVITISETVRRDLVRVLGMPEEKVFVAYPADSRLADHAAIPVPGLAKPFFLAVGITNARKNLPAILKAFALARARPGGGNAGDDKPGPRLAITGNADLIAAGGNGLPAEGVLNLGFVREGELRWLYENAAGLVYASRNEGFGIPLVDAAGFGCPVLCSDIPVFREVMGEAARYFDPEAPSALAAAMESILAGTGTRPDTDALKGKFSWVASARGMLRWIGAS